MDTNVFKKIFCEVRDYGYGSIYEAKSRVIPKAFGIEAEVSVLNFAVTLKSDKGLNIKRDSLF